MTFSKSKLSVAMLVAFSASAYAEDTANLGLSMWLVTTSRHR